MTNNEIHYHIHDINHVSISTSIRTKDNNLTTTTSIQFTSNLNISYANHPHIHSKTGIYISTSRTGVSYETTNCPNVTHAFWNVNVSMILPPNNLNVKASFDLGLHLNHEKFRMIISLGLNIEGITLAKMQHLKFELSYKEKQTSLFNDSDSPKQNSISIWPNPGIRFLSVRHAMFVSNN